MYRQTFVSQVHLAVTPCEGVRFSILIPGQMSYTYQHLCTVTNPEIMLGAMAMLALFPDFTWTPKPALSPTSWLRSYTVKSFEANLRNTFS